MLKKAVILGGGLSGCTMASLLRKEGYAVTLIEKYPWIGGLCKTFTLGQNKYEFGPHVFHSDKPHVVEMAKHLAPLQETRFRVKSCPFNNIERLFDYPLTVSSILKLDNPGDIIWELYRLNPRELDSSNFESYVISMIGATLYNLFIKNYNIKQWGLPPSRMSMKWAPKRISFNRDNEAPFHHMWSAYPPSGYDGFFRALTRGVRIIKGTFREIRSQGNSVKGVVLDNGRQIRGDLFVSSIPLDILLQSREQLTYRGIYKSFLQLRRPRLIDALWYTFPNHYNFTRIVEYKGYNFEHNNTSIVSAAFPFDSKEIDTILEAHYDHEFRAAVQHLFKIRNHEIIKQFGMKDAYSYPVITDRNENLFKCLLQELTGFENLFTVGRLGLFSYIPMHICMHQCLQVMELIRSYDMLSRGEKTQQYLRIR